MTQVILQPCGNKDSRQHYADTIEIPIPLETLRTYLLKTEYEELRNRISDSSVATWGVTPGKNGVNVKKWSLIETGDPARFSQDGGVFASATVVSKVRNEQLAETLWGRDNRGQTWEYIYFLDEVHPQHIPYASFNAAAGYASNNVIQGFSVLNEQRSERLIDRFDLESRNHYPDVSEEEYALASTAITEGPLDQPAKTHSRREQGFLRRFLFGNRAEGTCTLCQKSFPVGFLVAAHIKRRADCSESERRDYKNVVMPLCRFGCDELFERGFIGVQDGIIVNLRPDVANTTVKSRISDLSGKICRSWTPESSPYFEAHYSRWFNADR